VVESIFTKEIDARTNIIDIKFIDWASEQKNLVDPSKNCFSVFTDPTLQELLKLEGRITPSNKFFVDCLNRPTNEELNSWMNVKKLPEYPISLTLDRWIWA